MIVLATIGIPMASASQEHRDIQEELASLISEIERHISRENSSMGEAALQCEVFEERRAQVREFANRLTQSANAYGPFLAADGQRLRAALNVSLAYFRGRHSAGA